MKVNIKNIDLEEQKSIEELFDNFYRVYESLIDVMLIETIEDGVKLYLISILENLQKNRLDYCLTRNAIIKEELQLPSEKFVEKWVSKQLEDINVTSALYRIENEGKIQLLEKILDYGSEK